MIQIGPGQWYMYLFLSLSLSLSFSLSLSLYIYIYIFIAIYIYTYVFVLLWFKTPCGVDTVALAFGARQAVIRFAICGGWMLEDGSLPSLICIVLGSWRGLVSSWQFLCDFDRSGAKKLGLLAWGFVEDNFGDLQVYSPHQAYTSSKKG